MKITHLFLLAVSLLLLASSGLASRPRTTRECHQANGNCQWFGCTYPLVWKGKCGVIKKCCISHQNN